MNLLAVVQAEEHAEQLVQEAEQAKTTSIQHALKERERKLTGLHKPEAKKPTLKEKRLGLSSFEKKAKKNKAKAIKKILEELYAVA
ncbi:MAG: hypothetical protein OXR66_02675 [Candidatus Woesearchaeota archaeon]|nr:hypothetical protein [Candidatus Woesearchaeota archaeon]